MVTPCLAPLATPCRFIDDALLALLGLTTETRPTHNTVHGLYLGVRRRSPGEDRGADPAAFGDGGG